MIVCHSVWVYSSQKVCACLEMSPLRSIWRKRMRFFDLVALHPEWHYELKWHFNLKRQFYYLGFVDLLWHFEQPEQLLQYWQEDLPFFLRIIAATITPITIMEHNTINTISGAPILFCPPWFQVNLFVFDKYKDYNKCNSN